MGSVRQVLAMEALIQQLHREGLIHSSVGAAKEQPEMGCWPTQKQCMGNRVPRAGRRVRGAQLGGELGHTGQRLQAWGQYIVPCRVAAGE